MLTNSFTITNIIIAVTCVVSIIAFNSPELMHKWIFSPYETRYNKQYYRFITGGLLHAGWWHLLLNMYVFYMFGNFVEQRYGELFDTKGMYYYIMLYVGGLIISNIPSYVKYHNDPAYQSLGASGAVSAVLLTFILIAPFESVYFMGLLKLPAWAFGAGYMAYEYWAGRKQYDNINHDAHLVGALFGLLFSIVMKPSLVTDLAHYITNHI